MYTCLLISLHDCLSLLNLSRVSIGAALLSLIPTKKLAEFAFTCQGFILCFIITTYWTWWCWNRLR